tara:strand:- start:2582 stop:3136 length:555 start_codon:yes stop_codon:yes gene_type:complete
MKKSILLVLIQLAFLASCNEEKKRTISDSEEENLLDLSEEDRDTIFEEAIVEPMKESAKQLKEELTAKGFKTFDYVDEKTQDTILMQQYFMAFLKTGPIRGQNEEESAELQEAHLAHLTKMYELGYADISGPFGDDGDIRGITIYNVPTLKMADSLANADPMVKAGRLEIEIHPWWAAKGFPLR